MTDPTSNPWSSLSTSFAHILNFISSDYSALEPFQNNSAAVRTIRALYIVIITVLCLNILIAMLNLKIKRADKNAANLYHLQMAALQIEIELDLLSSSERGSRHWFPQWFTYSLTETERRVWEDYIDKNKLKWDEENDFDESKDNAPLSPPSAKSERQNGDAAIMDPTAQPAGANVVKNDPQSINSDTEASPAPENSTSPSTNPHTTEAPTPLHSGPSTNPSATTKESTKSRSSHSQQSLLDEPIPTAEEKLGASAVEANSRDNINSLNGATVRLACKICGSPGMICQGCQLVAYCGKEHQRQDWRSHKTACKGKAKA